MAATVGTLRRERVGPGRRFAAPAEPAVAKAPLEIDATGIRPAM